MATMIGELLARLSLDDKLTAGLAQAGSALSAYEGKWAEVGRGMAQTGSALSAAITVPIAGIGVAAAKSAIDFESAFAGVRKTVDGTEQDFRELSAGFRAMGNDIPTSVNSLLAVGEAAGQLGIKKDDILQFTRTMADLGETTNLSAEEAATATAQIQNIFGAAGVDVDRFGATLVALGNAGASTEKDIISMGLRIAGAGTQVGLSQAEVLSFASALSSVGIEADAGGTAISRAFLTINDAVMGGGKELDEFARIAGMSTAGFARAFEQDAAAATNAFIGGLARVRGEGENVNQTLGNLELGEIRVRDALLRASGAAGMLSEQLAIGEQAWEENSALTEEARKRYETTEAQLQKLWNKLTDVAVTLGQSMLPAIIDVVGAMDPLIDAAAGAARMFGELPTGVQMSVFAFGGLAAAVGPVVWVTGQLITAATTVGGLLVTLTGATSGWAAAGTIASGAFSALWPVVAAVGAAMAGWTVGTWIGELTGLTDAVAGLAAKTGEFLGILPEGTAKQLEFSRAAADALPQVQGSAAAVKDMSGASEIQTRVQAAVNESLAQGAMAHRTYKADTDAAAEALKQERKALADLKAELSGDTVETESQRWVAAIAAIGGATKLTADEQERASGILNGAIEKYQAIGTQAPPAVLQLAMALDASVTAAQDAATGIELLQGNIDKAKPSVADMGRDLNQMSLAMKGLGASAANVNLPAFKAPVQSSFEKAQGMAAGNSLSASMGATVKEKLGPTIIGAFQGGGNVGKSVGGLLGNTLGEWAGKAAGPALGKMLGKGIGGAVGTMFGPVGTMVGGFLGDKIGNLAGKAFGKLFGGNKEGKEVKAMRDDFIAAAGGMEALQAKAQAAGVSLDKLMSAKKVEDLKAAISALDGGLNEHAQNLQIAKQAAEEFGIPAERMGQAFKQAESDLDAESMLTKINALVDSGVDLATIIEFAGDDVGAFIHRAITMGTSVPKEFEKIAAEMIAQGTLLDANGEKFTDLSQIPFAENLDAKFSKLIDKLTAFLDGLNSIPDQIDVDINARTNIVDPGYGDGGVTEMATGGVVTAPTHILAGEAGPEAIVPLDRLGEFGSNNDLLASEVRDLKQLMSRLLVQMPATVARSTRDALRGGAL